jgi:hypothetical protein
MDLSDDALAVSSAPNVVNTTANDQRRRSHALPPFAQIYCLQLLIERGGLDIFDLKGYFPVYSMHH